MRLYDGIGVKNLSDQQLVKEYTAVNARDYSDFYEDKLGYLWFRLRELYYECQHRGITVDSPRSFVGEDRTCFNYWVPSYDEKRSALLRVMDDIDETHTLNGKEVTRKQIARLDPMF